MINMLVMREYRLLLFWRSATILQILWHTETFVNTEPYGIRHFKTQLFFAPSETNLMRALFIIMEYKLLLFLAMGKVLKHLWYFEIVIIWMCNILKTSDRRAKLIKLETRFSRNYCTYVGYFSCLIPWVQFSSDLSQTLWGHWVPWWNTSCHFSWHWAKFYKNCGRLKFLTWKCAISWKRLAVERYGIYWDSLFRTYILGYFTCLITWVQFGVGWWTLRNFPC